MTTTSNTSSSEEVFLVKLQECLQTDNKNRTAFEAIYQDIPDEKKPILLMYTLGNITISEPIRSFAAVKLRHLFQRQFENFWPKYSSDQQLALKNDLLVQIKQLDDDETIRKNICYIIAELAKNLMDENEQLQWPEVMEFLFQSVNSTHSVLKESALTIFQAFPGIFGNKVEQFKQIIHQIFLNCLNDKDTKVRYRAATSFASYLQYNSKNTQLLNIYQDCLPYFISTIEHSLANSNDDTVLKTLINIIENTVKYLRPVINDIFNLCLQIMKKKVEFEESRRHLALEILVTLAETASEMVRKVPHKYINELISQLLEMMVDLNDDPEWSTKDTIEDEENDCNAFVGKRSLDRLFCALHRKTIFNYILTTIQTMLQSFNWCYRYGGLMAISVICKGFYKEISALLNKLVNDILVFLKDSHPRIRYAACNALGQISINFQGRFQKKFHLKVIPELLSILDDYENSRTQAHAGVALVNFAKGCPSYILVKHLPQIIGKLEEVLNRKYQEFIQHNRKLVLEQIITTLTAIVDTVAKDFSPYYDRFMPQLKYLFKISFISDYRILRSKIIECISIIGLTVGKEKFINDCYEIMQELIKTQVDFENNDLQISYFISALTRIYKILGKDYEQYLPIVMESVLKIAAFKPKLTTILFDRDIDVEEDDNSEEFNVDDQTTGLEEKANACLILVCYAKELKEGFINYIEETTKLMISLLKFYCHKGIRTTANESLPYLLDCAKLRGNDYIYQLWQYINKELFKSIETELNYEVLVELFTSFGKCIETLGVSSLTKDELNKLTIILDNHFKKYFERVETRHDEKIEEEIFKEDVCDADILNHLSNIVHSLLITYKDSYLIYFDTLVPHFNKLIQSTHSLSDRQWALRVFDDVIQFTGVHSYRYSQFFLPHMIKSLTDLSSKIRQAAAYGFGAMGMNGGLVYAHSCAAVLPHLITLINAPNSRSIKNNTATENVISAITKILKYNYSSIDNLDKLHQVWFSWLPIYEDKEGIPYVYNYLCDLIESNNLIIIGQNNSNVSNLIKLLNDVFAKSFIEINSTLYQRMKLILQHLQTVDINLPSSSHLSKNIFTTENSFYPRLSSTVDEKYLTNEFIQECLKCVPNILLSQRSLNILHDCDLEEDTIQDVMEHIIDRIKEIEITIDKTKSKYFAHYDESYKTVDSTYVLKINTELFDDCINAQDQPMKINQAKLNFIISVCHEFVHHKTHKYLLHDKWARTGDGITPPDIAESGYYWENLVIGGRVVKQDKAIYSFLTHNDGRISLDNDLCQFLLNKLNYDDKNLDAYSRKEKLQQQEDLQTGSGRRPRRKITRLSIDLKGTQKLKKTRSESYKRFRLTPKHEIIAEVTLGNETDEDIVYPDLPQNCGGLHAFLYRYNDDNNQLFSVTLPNNDNDWTCGGLRKRLRAFPLTIPDPVIININESKCFNINLFKITSNNEQENMNYNGHYRLEIKMGYYLKRNSVRYFGEQAITFEVEYDNGINNDENVGGDQLESQIIKE